MSEHWCKKCGEPIFPDLSFSDIGETKTCPFCGAEHSVEYDESWDGENEVCVFWLELADSGYTRQEFENDRFGQTGVDFKQRKDPDD